MAGSPYLLEVSWETCNKVGGIHTVVTSKLSHSLAAFPGRYLAVGPLLEGDRPEFSERPMPEAWKGMAAALAADFGIDLRYGAWQVPEEPPVLLVGWRGLVGPADTYKAAYWERYGLDSLGADFYDFTTPLLWGAAVGKFLKAFAALQGGPVIAQCHEWLSAGAILEGKADGPANLRTVFTTHATVLGRALMDRNRDIYKELTAIRPDDEARACGVGAKHQLEGLGARLADAFTAVSDITATEAAAFLGRKPDVVTKNGIGPTGFPTFDKLSVSRAAVRERLNAFLTAYFFPSYRFDLSKAVLQYTMGRYEPHNKGYDMYAASLAALNRRLKQEGSDRTVVSFFLVPADPTAIRAEAAAQSLIYGRISQVLQRLAGGQIEAAYGQLLDGELEAVKERLLPEERRTAIDHVISRLPRPVAPRPCPFELRSGDNDRILRLFAEYGLANLEEDRVKVVFIPTYLDGFDGLFNLPLYELLTGFDFGVFPSYYEPWGYTPLESLALGVPAVTSDLAGFGLAVQRLDPPGGGISVMKRSDGSFEDQALLLADLLHDEHNLPERVRVERRIDAYRTAYRFSWDDLYAAYDRAYALALAA